MCRLYGLRATHATKVACELVEAQNALIRQAEGDARGLVNDDGWGLGLIRDGRAECDREVAPADESAEYREEASEATGTTVLAHVRRATVGQVGLANTHPFRDGTALLAHNGHVGGFEDVKERMLAEMRPEDREAIRGTTDSEHVFRLLQSRAALAPGTPLRDILEKTVRDVAIWSQQADPESEVALNLLWARGDELVGSRLGRSLWYVERDGPHRCEVCGEIHPDVADPEDYRAVTVASERITGEDWREVPEASVFEIDETFRLLPAPVWPGGAPD